MLSISEIARLTGKSRETILRASEGMTHEAGHKGAHLFDCWAVVRKLLATKPGSQFAEAKTEESRTRTEKIAFELSTLQRENIPLPIVKATVDDLFTEISFVLKKLPESDQQQLRQEMLAITSKVEGWGNR